MKRYAQIISTGSYVPERVVTNAEMDDLLGETTSDWLMLKEIRSRMAAWR